MKQTILVTGASGGFGKLIVHHLLENDHQVIATMRNADGRNKPNAEELSAKGAIIVELDVTDNASVENAIAEALDKTGGIDVVINNAGLGVMGYQESFTPEDWQRLFDINVFGVQRVIRAILPHFKAKKAGTIMNISSLLGRMTVPFYGPYNASKWALEAMSENYRTELSQLGIDVVIVEPGGFATSFIDALMRPSDSSRDADYASFQPTPQFFLENFEQGLASNPEQDPANVAKAIVSLLEMPAGERPLRTIVDKMGMGDALAGLNQASDQITSGIYGAFQIDHLLKLKK